MRCWHPAPATTRRRGFAAALAVCMLAAVAGLVAASFHSVAEARRGAHRGSRQEEAAGAADTALERALASWDVAWSDSLPVGAVDSSSADAGAGGTAASRAYVIRITKRLFWVAGVGRAAPGTSVESHRAHHLVVEVLRPGAPVRAALTSGGDVLAGDDARILGADSQPPGWTDCPSPDTTNASAVLVPPGASARLEGGGPIEGARVDSLAGDPATYEVFGRVSTEALAQRADIAIAAGAIVAPAPDSAADCQAGPAAWSWGEPVHDGRSPGCERLYPVVHAAGDVVVTGGRGQGVLIVAGRLRIQGPFYFAGVVIAFGGVEVTGSDVRVYGAVFSAGGGVTWRAAGELRRSTCAVQRATAAAGKPYAIGLRAWSELP